MHLSSLKQILTDKSIFIIIIILFNINNSLSGQISDRISTNVSIKGSETIEHQSGIPMIFTNPKNGYFDPQHLKNIYPELDIEQGKFAINYPVMQEFSDTLFLMMFIRDKAYSNKGIINIAIIGVISDKELMYYIDNNSDNIFSSNESKFSFSPSVERKKIELNARGGSNEFYLLNPIFEPDLNTPEPVPVGSWTKINERTGLKANFSATFGAGHCSISYTSINPLISKEEYSATIFASCLIRTGIVAQIKKWTIALYPGFQYIEYSDRHKITFYTNGLSQTSYMTGQWVRAKISAEVALGYDIVISPRLVLCPEVTGGVWMPVKNQVFDIKLEPSESSRYSDTYRYDLGLKLKILADESSYVSIKTGIIKTSMDVIQFLPDYDTGSDLKYMQIYLGIGYTISFAHR